MIAIRPTFHRIFLLASLLPLAASGETRALEGPAAPPAAPSSPLEVPAAPVVPPVSPEVIPPAPQAFIAGVVLEKGTGIPLEGVTVIISGSADGVDTDIDGRFRIDCPVGRVGIGMSMAGYAPFTQLIDVGKDGKTLKPIFLEPRADRTAAMVVQTQRVRKEARLEVLNPTDIERTPGTFGDPIRAVESLPNVARPKLLDGALVVRGAEPANTVVYWDGHPIPFLYHFGVWKSVVSPGLVAGVRFYPGGLPAAQGDVLQAVVEVQGKEVSLERAQAQADVNLTDTSLSLSVPVPGVPWGIAAAARFSYLSLAILGVSALADSDASLFPRYLDFQARVDGVVGGGTLALTLLGARDSVSLGPGALILSPSEEERFAAFEVNPYEPYVTEFYHFHGVYERKLRPDLSLYSSTLVGLERQISLIPFDGTIIQLPPLTRLERPVLGERFELRWQRSPQQRWVGGLELRHKEAAIRDLSEIYAGSSSALEVPPEEILPVNLAALYGRLELSQAGGRLLIPEVRASLYGFHQQWVPWIEPRMTVIQPLDASLFKNGLGKNGLVLKSALGVHSQLPEERQYASEGNPDLKLMKSIQGSVGLELGLGEGMGLESSLFAGRMWDLVQKGTDLVYQETDYGAQAYLRRTYFGGDGWGFGGELTFKRDMTHRVHGSASYAFTRSLRRVEEGWIPGDYDQPHTVTGMISARLFERVHLSARLRVGSGQPFTPYEGAWSSTEQQYVPIEGPRNSARLPLYHQLDIRLDRTLLKERYKVNYYLDIQNTYLAQNPVIQLPSWNYQEVGSYAWIPLVPTLGVKGEF